MAGSTAGNKFIWHDLLTSDTNAAIAFYTKVVGWGTEVWPGEKPYTMWTADGQAVGGVIPEPSGGPPSWLGYISSPDVDASVKQATGLGGTLLMQPTDIPEVGRYAVMNDPQGATFAIFTPKPGSPEPAEPARGKFSWHELMTTDPVAGLGFYETLFGFEKTSAMDMGDMGQYQMFGHGEVPFGGAMKKSAEMPGPPVWSHYILIDDINRGVEAVKANGGQVLNGPMEVPGGDMIANCVDPQGAMFSLHALAAK